MLADQLVDWILTALHPGEALRMAVRLRPNLSLRRGTILGQVRGTTETFGAYGQANVDGTEVAKIILESDCATDGDGLVTVASLTVGRGRMADRKFDRVQAFYCGTFACADLVGLDAAAATRLGRLVQGTFLTGILRMG